jgi:hypothetical protein
LPEFIVHNYALKTGMQVNFSYGLKNDVTGLIIGKDLRKVYARKILPVQTE